MIRKQKGANTFTIDEKPGFRCDTGSGLQAGTPHVVIFSIRFLSMEKEGNYHERC
jgi:hypothetical protein